jgi:hypothetical protein
MSEEELQPEYAEGMKPPKDQLRPGRLPSNVKSADH